MHAINKRWVWVVVAVPIIAAVVWRGRAQPKSPRLSVAQTLDARTPLRVRVLSQVLTYP